MSSLRDIVQSYVSGGSVPGAVGLVARGDRVEVAAAGFAGLDGMWVPEIVSSAPELGLLLRAGLGEQQRSQVRERHDQLS